MDGNWNSVAAWRYSIKPWGSNPSLLITKETITQAFLYNLEFYHEKVTLGWLFFLVIKSVAVCQSTLKIYNFQTQGHFSTYLENMDPYVFAQTQTQSASSVFLIGITLFGFLAVTGHLSMAGSSFTSSLNDSAMTWLFWCKVPARAFISFPCAFFLWHPDLCADPGKAQKIILASASTLFEWVHFSAYMAGSWCALL